MNSPAITFLSCLLVLSAQGMPDNRSRRCKCSNGYIGQVDTRLIRTEPAIYQPSIFCQQIEIIITIKKEEKCVNPKSPLGKRLLENKRKHEKRALMRTKTSSQTNTQSSTRLPPTDFAPATM